MSAMNYDECDMDISLFTPCTVLVVSQIGPVLGRLEY